MTAFLAEIARRDAILWVTGLVQLALAVAFIVGLVVDDRVVLAGRCASAWCSFSSGARWAG
jgi:hypothetical protein